MKGKVISSANKGEEEGHLEEREKIETVSKEKKNHADRLQVARGEAPVKAVLRQKTSTVTGKQQSSNKKERKKNCIFFRTKRGVTGSFFSERTPVNSEKCKEGMRGRE